MIQPNDVITDGTVEWTVRDIRGGTDGNPVGTILAFAGNGAIPDGYLLCDGAAVSRTDYADLFAVIGATYGSGDGSTTFNLPNLTDKFLQGDSTAGVTKPAGLPNITGMVQGSWQVNFDNSNGAFTRSGTNTVHASGSTSYSYPQRFHLDASRSSPIYGASTTVQPPAVTTKYIIKY